jgi:hypothetical protein
MKNAVFWDVPPCGISEDCSASIIRMKRIGELGTTLALTSNESTLKTIVFLRRVLRLLVTADVPSSQILVTRMMEVLRSSKTSVLTRATRRSITEDGILNEIELN